MIATAPSRPWRGALLVAALAFAAGIGLSHFQRAGTDAATVDGLLWPDPPRVSRVALTDQYGQPFDASRLDGRWTLLFFGFTHCPDVCPTSLEALARAASTLRADPRFGTQGQVLFVSVDPERDTPEVLARYVAYFAPDLLGATGSGEALSALARDVGALFMKVPQAGADYTVDHSAGIFFIDPGRRLLSVLTPPHDAAAVVARFDAIADFLESQP